MLTIGLFGLVRVAGVIAVDFGLWWAERRDSRTDADAAVLRPKCDMQGSAGSSFQIRGVFINIQELEGNVRPLDPFGTRRIVLIE